MVNSKYKGWGIVVAMMRVVHVVIGIIILLSVYGPSFLHFVIGLRPMMANVHMGHNPKMYALASVFAVFNNGAFMLLPWRNSEFSQRSFGLPTMDIFRTIQLTTICTASVTIGSQIPYLSGTSLNQNPTLIFFYINIIINSCKLCVSGFGYCVHAAILRESSTKFIDKIISSKDTNFDEDDEIELGNMTSNPIQKRKKKNDRLTERKKNKQRNKE